MNTVLWVYIILLIGGGLFGFMKAKSQISLITASVAAALLIITTIPGLFSPSTGRAIADIVMAVLLVVFAVRLAKSQKFIPSGLLLVLTVIALALRHVHFT